jgi:hypothetical protein
MSRASARVGMARSPGARLLGAVGAAGVGVEELAQGETIGGFGRSGLGVDGHRSTLLRVGLG